ncbi:hypothetical protein ACKWTF_009670 [Chironomus riparius]
MSNSKISQFYVQKNIFCTGATGFMGKVLVEKLLRDCGELNIIYILVRTKKGVTPQKRYENYINDVVFDRIRSSKPDQFKKIRVIKGDVTLDNLDLDPSDEEELIENVNLVFHCAANVRFDLKLKEAVNFNLNGTFSVLRLAEKMKNLQVFMHVSTTYCHCKEVILEERYYRANENPFGIMEMVKTLNDETLEHITPKLLKDLPNTYALTKGLTENLVHTFQGKFPIVIARPSIVIAAWQEPYPGFVEGLNGPTGLLVAGAKGVLRSMHCNPNYPAETVPVDISINCMIALAYKKSIMDDKDVLYCNMTDNGTNPITWGESLEMGRKVFYKYPMSISLWYPDGSIKSNYFVHLWCVIFFHFLPAYFIDGLLFITGNKPFLVNVQKRINQGLKVLQYYTTRKWTFHNDNFKKLSNEMNDIDKEIFNCDMSKINHEVYARNCVFGIRQFIVKEKPEQLPKARSMLRKLYIVDRMVTFIFYGLIILWIYSYFGKFFYSN